MPALATDELVGIAWLRSVPSLTGVPVATFLAGENDGEPAWSTSGLQVYIQVSSTPLGLPPDLYFPTHRPRLTCSCWALPRRWSSAAQLGALIRAATYDSELIDVVVNVADGFEAVRILGVQALAEPTRVPGATAGDLARYDIPLLIEWMSAAQ